MKVLKLRPEAEGMLKNTADEGGGRRRS